MCIIYEDQCPTCQNWYENDPIACPSPHGLCAIFKQYDEGLGSPFRGIKRTRLCDGCIVQSRERHELEQEKQERERELQDAISEAIMMMQELNLGQSGLDREIRRWGKENMQEEMRLEDRYYEMRGRRVNTTVELNDIDERIDQLTSVVGELGLRLEFLVDHEEARIWGDPRMEMGFLTRWEWQMTWARENEYKPQGSREKEMDKWLEGTERMDTMQDQTGHDPDGRMWDVNRLELLRQYLPSLRDLGLDQLGRVLW